MYDFGFGTLIGDYIFLSFFVLCNTIALIVWILTLITGKHSFMDQLWPILPSVYTWLFVSAALFFNPSKNESISISSSLKDIQQPALIRILIIACFLTAWSVRLTFIFWRRGYYKWSFEDHRWDHIKKKYNYPEKKLAFHIFNFVFMAILQNWILFGYALPIWYLLTNDSTQTGLNVFDYIVLVAYVIFYLIEAIADEQQWRFQSNKYKWIADNTLPYTPQEVEDFQRGFLCRGLFAYSRHPNYFGDILLWWSVYFLTVSAKFSNFSSFWDLFNYSLLSAALMTLLFQQSVSVSEMFTARKYPEYTYYKTKVNRIIFGFRAYVPKKSAIEIDGE